MRPSPLLLLPLPVPLQLFSEAVQVAQRAWRREGHHRKPLTLAHLREEVLGGMSVLAVYDMPVTGDLPDSLREYAEAVIADGDVQERLSLTLT